jgi:hypothetical protein
LDAHEENLSSGVLMKQIHVERYKAKKVLFWKHWENFKSGWFLEQKYHGNCNARCDCYQTPMLHIETELVSVVRASPPMHSVGLQTVQFIAKKSKCAGLSHQLVFLHQIGGACRGW